MRATATITWLLLTLSFLFHSVCCDENQGNTSVVSVPAGGNTSATAPTVSGKPKTDDTTETPGGKDNQTTLAPIPSKSSAAVTTPATSVTATPEPTIKPSPTQQQLLNVTNPTTPPISITDASTAVVNNATAAVAATSALPKATTQTAMANNSGSSLVSPNVATTQTPGVWQPSETPRTEAPTSQSGNTANVGTTKMSQVLKDSLTTRKESMAHTTTITAKTGRWDNNGALTVTGTPAVPSGPSGTKAGTTDSQAAPTAIPATSTTTTLTAHKKMFSYSLNKGHEKEEEKDLVELCKGLMVNFQNGTCILSFRHHNGKILFDSVKVNGEVKPDWAAQLYEEITKKPTDNKTLIAILASCGALLIMIVILAVCASHHRKPYNENQQHLTEELHTVENGYHDNPTLEVMEVQPEMQEKKMALNGEFNDNWIVPMDNLLKEDMPDEEDTHL